MKHLVVLLVLMCALAGCAAPQAAPAESIAVAAAYLAPEANMALASDDLAAHPEVTVVRDMDALKAADAPALWIDAACLDRTDGGWLAALEGVPIVVIGYGDGLYAFAERLGFPIEVPAGASGDPDRMGFCVWLQRADGASMRGFAALTVQAVLDACAQMAEA